MSVSRTWSQPSILTITTFVWTLITSHLTTSLVSRLFLYLIFPFPNFCTNPLDSIFVKPVWLHSALAPSTPISIHYWGAIWSSSAWQGKPCTKWPLSIWAALSPTFCSHECYAPAKLITTLTQTCLLCPFLHLPEMLFLAGFLRGPTNLSLLLRLFISASLREPLSALPLVGLLRYSNSGLKHW